MDPQYGIARLPKGISFRQFFVNSEYLGLIVRIKLVKACGKEATEEILIFASLEEKFGNDSMRRK
jgi:hypothetical protein